VRLLAPTLLFSLPLLPHLVAHWALNVSDRIILAANSGTDVVAVYGVAQQFAAPTLIIVSAMSKAAMPRYFQPETNDSSHLRQLLTHQAVLVMITCFAAALLAPIGIELFAPPPYSLAGTLVGWVILGFGFFGLYLGPMNIVSLVSGRTTWVWITAVAAALANVALNIVLVPTYGATAAAVNTAIGYAILALLIHLYVRRILRYSITYVWATVIRVGAAVSGGYVLTTLAAPDVSTLPGIVVRLVAALVALVAVIRLVGTPPSDLSSSAASSAGQLARP
jgi:O-antigen/teichoic acid export membrane protein